MQWSILASAASRSSILSAPGRLLSGARERTFQRACVGLFMPVGGGYLVGHTHGFGFASSAAVNGTSDKARGG